MTANAVFDLLYSHQAPRQPHMVDALERNTTLCERSTALFERDMAALERNTAALEHNTAVLERDTAAIERNTALFERDTAVFERDTALFERDTALFERDTAALKRDTVVFERNTALFERDTTVFERDTTAFDGSEMGAGKMHAGYACAATTCRRLPVCRPKSAASTWFAATDRFDVMPIGVANYEALRVDKFHSSNDELMADTRTLCGGRMGPAR